jgi:hypothetical protein
MIGWTGIFMFPAAGWTIAAGLRGRAKAKAVQDWPIAPGIILSSAAELVYAGSGVFLQTPSVTYQYTVAHRNFVSASIQTARGAYASWSYARAAAAKYSTGTSVAVFYNPREPSEGYLEVADDTAWRKIEVGIFYATTPFALGLFAIWFNSSL